MGHNGSTTTTFAFATMFLLISLAMVAVTFSTNSWRDILVQREELVKLGESRATLAGAVFYSRHIGLFRTCYPDEASFIDNDPNMVDGNCLRETGYEIPTRNPATVGYGSSYDMRIHLLRSQFAALVLAMLFLFVASITAVLGCWNSSPSMLRSTGVLVFVGMFFIAGGMALFHGIIYLDDKILNNVPGTQAQIREKGLSDVTYARLADKTSYTFGFSYILGWLALGLAALSGIFYLIVGYRFAVKRRETYGSKRTRNRAYDYMDKNPPYVEYYGGPQGGPPPQDVLYIDNNAYNDTFSGYRY